MSEELGRSSRVTELLRKARPSFVIGALLTCAALTAVVVVACDETGPSPVGEHFDDAGEDTSTPPDEDAGDEGGDGGEEEGGDSGADSAVEDDAADAADGD